MIVRKALNASAVVDSLKELDSDIPKRKVSACRWLIENSSQKEKRFRNIVKIKIIGDKNIIISNDA